MANPRIIRSGGPDPLDFVSMLSNRGNVGRGIAEHWHYISFGLSDLYGDSRLHEVTGPDDLSGFGFELTFRLKREPGEERAPLWPATLLNSLARYVFQTGNKLNCGDHVPWNVPLDAAHQSYIRHMLVTEDPQLKELDTPLGSLQFRQVVGVTEAEMRAAQRWNGNGVLELLALVPFAAGPYYVTSMTREQSIFDTHPHFVQIVTENIEQDGSNLGHVTSVCTWQDTSRLAGTTRPRRISEDSDEERDVDSVHLKFDLEAAELLPLVARGRLLQGKYFVFQNVKGQVIMFVTPEFDADIVMVDEQHPMKIRGDMLQIFCADDYVDKMALMFDVLQHPQDLINQLPKLFQLHKPDVEISIYLTGQIPEH